MYFSEKEKKIVKIFYRNINEYEKSNMILMWNNDDWATATFDTCFENDNELDMNDEKYEEYISFVFKATKVCGNPPIYVTEDKYFMVNYHNFPKEILVDGKKIN